MFFNSHRSKLASPWMIEGVTIDKAIAICLACRPGPMDLSSPPLSSTNKGCYPLPSQVLPSLWRPLHFGSTYARDLSKTKVTIYLIWESHMCRKPDSLFTFYLLYFYIYGVLFSFFFLFSKTRQHLRCNLLFGLIGHFGLLKDINICFFLSIS